MSATLAAHLRPAIRFLLERVSLPLRFKTEDSGYLPDSLTQQELVEEARKQRVTGLLLQWAEHHAGTPKTLALRNTLAPLQQSSAIRTLGLVRETLQLVELLRHSGIDVLVVKGPFLSKRYYGDYALRHPGDVDMLVAPERAMDADRVLRDHGYHRTKPVKDLNPKRLELYLRTQHETGYCSPDGTSSVELHWRYADAPCLSPYPFEELWRRSERLDAGGGQVPVLSTPDVLIHLAIHGALDGWSRLKWLADLPRVLQALSAPALQALMADARGRGIHRPLALALELARIRTEDGSGGLEEPALDVMLPRIARRLQSPDYPSLTLPQKISAWREDGRYQDQLVDSAAARRDLFRVNLIMPADFDRLGTPDWLTPALPWLARISRAWRRIIE